MAARTVRGTWVAAVLLVAGAAVASFSVLRGIDAFDEGLALQAAARVADGQLPYHDFLWAYGPGQPFLLGGLFEAFGPSLLAWRLIRVATDAAIAYVVFRLVERRAGTPLALLAWVTTAAAMAQPLSANPFAPALLFGLLAVVAASAEQPRLVAAGALTAVTAAWRLDFGVYTGLACLAALALTRDGWALRRYTAIAVGGSFLAYLPFIMLVGPADLWSLLVAQGLEDREYWTLPFPWSYDGSFGLLSPRDWKDLLSFYVPLLLVTGLLAAAAAEVGRWRRDRIALLVLGGCFLLYLRSRTDPFHETPLIVILAILLPLVTMKRLRPGAAVLLGLLALYTVGNRAVALLDPPKLERLHLGVADGVRVPPEQARALPRAVRTVREHVPPGEPIYVVTLRSDLVRIGNPLFYVLADRPNALDKDFDLQTSEPEQRRVTEQLARERPRAIVRWNDPESAGREPNKRGEPSGSRLLDLWIARNYRQAGSFGDYEVLVPV